MIFVSPQPHTWYAIYQRLKSHWDNEINVGDAPPMALVLSGWTMSSDFEKQDRWKMTLRWAEQNNCSHLIPDLKEDEKYFVSFELSSYTLSREAYKAYKTATKEEIQHAIFANKWKDLVF
jgi:hypothetical protein